MGDTCLDLLITFAGCVLHPSQDKRNSLEQIAEWRNRKKTEGKNTDDQDPRWGRPPAISFKVPSLPLLGLGSHSFSSAKQEGCRWVSLMKSTSVSLGCGTCYKVWLQLRKGKGKGKARIW